MSAIYTGAPHTIILNSENGKHIEKVALAAINPGHLMEVTSADKFKKHATAGGRSLKYFAKEDYLQGKTITTTDAYAADDVVLGHLVLAGDKVYAKLPAAAVAVTRGDALMSNGDGTLIKILAGSSGGNVLSSAVAASAAVSNLTAETAFDKSYTIPANFLKAGDIIRIRTQGIATSTNSTDTLNIKLKIGSTVIAATGALDVANNDIFEIDADLVIRTIGASGTLVAAGDAGIGVEGTATAKPFKLASTAVDTTATQAITVTATWSVASASNSVRLDVLDIQLLRADGSSTIAYADETVDNSLGATEAFIKAIVA